MKSDYLNAKFKKLQKILEEYSSFLLVIHPSPDADALGSSYALRQYLLSLPNTKKVEIYSIDEAGKNLGDLFNLNILSTNLLLGGKEVVIFLDRGDVYHKLEFDKKIKALKNKPKKIVNIDHHARTEIKKALNIRTTTASSTSEIIYRFFEFVDFSINVDLAQFLLSGIWFDTGGFKHSNTTPEVLEIAGILMRKGASVSKVNRALSFNKPLAVLKLWGLAIERAHINKLTGMVVSYITMEDMEKYGVSVKDLDPAKLSELLNTISETKFSLMLTEREGNKIKASLRSEEYKKVDVSKIAKMFKGGGHKLASGFEVAGRLKPTKDGVEIV